MAAQGMPTVGEIRDPELPTPPMPVAEPYRMNPQREAALVQMRVRQRQEEASWAPMRRLQLLDDLWQLAFELRGSAPGPRAERRTWLIQRHQVGHAELSR